MKRKLICGLLLMTVLASGLARAQHNTAGDERLPELGRAPDFTLITQDGESLSLSELHGKVVVVSFIFTRCPGPCPLLTAKLVGIQRQLGEAFGKDVYFLSVTIDPEYDNPEVLKAYAEAVGSELSGWSFLTGPAEQIRNVARRYGVFHERQTDGGVDHNLLTSVIDHRGELRVQYMGERFDPAEFLRDLRSLLERETAL